MTPVRLFSAILTACILMTESSFEGSQWKGFFGLCDWLFVLLQREWSVGLVEAFSGGLQKGRFSITQESLPVSHLIIASGHLYCATRHDRFRRREGEEIGVSS